MSGPTLIFPMAGAGARFGGCFKPFLAFGDETFVEAAVRPFLRWRSSWDRLVFVYLARQEAEFSVASELRRKLGGVPFETVALAEPTRGPAETVARAVQTLGLSGSAIICDCDHSVDVGPLFEMLERDRADCVVPIWEVSEHEIESWSIARVAGSTVKTIAEKARPEGTDPCWGVIGCTYFDDVARVAETTLAHDLTNLSEVIQHLLQHRRTVRAVRIENAEFFGDPGRLAAAERARATIT